MDELNKNQIVLLVLLVSFVTSIATGIVTVTLLQQAPAAVTQTINRVVERTIEKTVPGDTKTETVIKEVPVIVTEEQLIVDVINSASPSVVRIAGRDGTTIGSGFIVGDAGMLASVSKLFPTRPADSEPYQVFLSQGRQGTARVVASKVDRGVTLLQLDPASLRDSRGDPVTVAQLAKLELAEAEALPGQTVVTIGVPDSGPITVSGGIVSGLFTNSTTGIATINTSAANQANLGGPLLNIRGKVIGISNDPGVALTSGMINAVLAGVSQ